MLSFLSKLQHWSWYLLLVVAPWQTRIILWQRDWYFSEWRSIAFWASDLVILLLIVVTVWRQLLSRQLLVDDSIKSKSLTIAFFGLVISAAVSSWWSLDHTVAWWTTIKLVEFGLLWWSVRHLAVAPLRDSGTWWALVGGGTIQTLIALGQFYRQGDLGLRWLGETLLHPDLPGVASFYLASGEKLMRAYGTLPHPNILAVYLVIVLLASVALWANRGDKSPRLFEGIIAIFYALFLWALFLTFARTVIAVAGLIALVLVIQHWRHLRSLILITFLVSILFTGVHWTAVQSRLIIARSDEAVQLRIYYNEQALHSATHQINVLGVGPGNFVTWLMQQHPHAARYLYQPAHNLYLLVYAEQGILGLGVWLAFVFLILRQAWRQGPIPIGLVAFVLIVGLFDHFPWTLQQGRIMLWTILGAVTHLTVSQKRV